MISSSGPGTTSPATDAAGQPEGVNLVDAFRVLDGVSELLGMVVEGREAHVATASGALFGRFAAADTLLDSLPGADLTHAAQLAEAKRLSAALKEKRALVAKYRELSLLTNCTSAQQTVAAVQQDVGMKSTAQRDGSALIERPVADRIHVSGADTTGSDGGLDIADLDGAGKLDELDPDVLSVDDKDVEVIDDF